MQKRFLIGKTLKVQERTKKEVAFVENKKELLKIAYDIAEDINNHESGDYMSYLTLLIDSSVSFSNDKDKQKEQLLKLLGIASEKGLSIVSGGKTEQNSFKNFIKERLCLYKNRDQYMIQNEVYKDLSLEELKYISLWSSRLVKSTKKNNSSNDHQNTQSNNHQNRSSNRNNNNHRGKQTIYQDKDAGNNAFAIAMEKAKRKK
jgi:hypothetical protein